MKTTHHTGNNFRMPIHIAWSLDLKRKSKLASPLLVSHRLGLQPKPSHHSARAGSPPCCLRPQLRSFAPQMQVRQHYRIHRKQVSGNKSNNKKYRQRHYKYRIHRGRATSHRTRPSRSWTPNSAAARLPWRCRSSTRGVDKTLPVRLKTWLFFTVVGDKLFLPRRISWRVSVAWSVLEIWVICIMIYIYIYIYVWVDDLPAPWCFSTMQCFPKLETFTKSEG